MNQLTETEISALNEALDDEYRAWATYDEVIGDFGDIPPFNNIREAEKRHIAALYALFTQYNLPIPENLHGQAKWNAIPAYRLLVEPV